MIIRRDPAQNAQQVHKARTNKGTNNAWHRQNHPTNGQCGVHRRQNENLPLWQAACAAGDAGGCAWWRRPAFARAHAACPRFAPAPAAVPPLTPCPELGRGGCLLSPSSCQKCVKCKILPPPLSPSSSFKVKAQPACRLVACRLLGMAWLECRSQQEKKKVMQRCAVYR